jgi:nucleoid DNA-binding protein
MPRSDRTLPLTRRTLRARVVEATGLPVAIAHRAVSVAIDAIADCLAGGGRAELRGVGSFRVTARKAGVGRNPKTGAPATKPARRVVRFKASGSLIRRLAGPPASPSTNGDLINEHI